MIGGELVILGVLFEGGWDVFVKEVGGWCTLNGAPGWLYTTCKVARPYTWQL